MKEFTPKNNQFVEALDRTHASYDSLKNFYRSKLKLPFVLWVGDFSNIKLWVFILFHLRRSDSQQYCQHCYAPDPLKSDDFLLSETPEELERALPYIEISEKLTESLRSVWQLCGELEQKLAMNLPQPSFEIERQDPIKELFKKLRKACFRYEKRIKTIRSNFDDGQKCSVTWQFESFSSYFYKGSLPHMQILNVARYGGKGVIYGNGISSDSMVYVFKNMKAAVRYKKRIKKYEKLMQELIVMESSFYETLNYFLSNFIKVDMVLPDVMEISLVNNVPTGAKDAKMDDPQRLSPKLDVKFSNN